MKSIIIAFFLLAGITANAQPDTTKLNFVVAVADIGNIHSITRNNPDFEDLNYIMVAAVTNQALTTNVTLPNVQANWLIGLWRELSTRPYRRVSAFISRVRTDITSSVNPATGTTHQPLIDFVNNYDANATDDNALLRNISIMITRRY